MSCQAFAWSRVVTRAGPKAPRVAEIGVVKGVAACFGLEKEMESEGEPERGFR
jgi:hypothetical protein